jgi:hypothetical protein
MLVDGEGFDAVDVEDMVALVKAAMTVPELSNRKRNANDDNALLSVNSCPGTGLASFLGFFPFRPRRTGTLLLLLTGINHVCRLC